MTLSSASATASLQYTGPTDTLSRGLSLGAAGGTVEVTAAGTVLTAAAAVTGSGGLTKAGPGTLRMTASNGYAGTTLVSGGVLKLSTGGSIAGSVINVSSGATFDVADLGSYTLASGKTLKGGGTVIGNLVISGTLAPGNSPGTQSNVGNQTWSGGAHYTWEIDDATGAEGGDAGWDLESITGNLRLSATAANPFIVDINSLVQSDACRRRRRPLRFAPAVDLDDRPLDGHLQHGRGRRLRRPVPADGPLHE